MDNLVPYEDSAIELVPYDASEVHTTFLSCSDIDMSET
jgi:hypothetical protein